MAWDVSITVNVPASRAARLIAARSATSPVADCTAEKATTSMSRPMASASRSTGAVSTVTPRSACTAQGKTFEVNSTSGTSTRAPSGTAAATGASNWETAAPVATDPGSTATSAANSFLATDTASAHGSQLVRPLRQSCSDRCNASHAGRGGGPYDEVFRYPGSTSHNAAASVTVSWSFSTPCAVSLP